VRVIRTAYGARVVDGRSFLSKVRDTPGPTDEVFDVLAAAIAEAPAGPAAVLGFAGGGMISPLRAMGDRRPIEAVDLDVSAEPLFRELCGGWCGTVRVDHGEAAAWLATRRTRFAAITDDLSTEGRDGATKPRSSLEALPGTIAARLRRDGWAIANALPVEGLSWAALVGRLAGALPEVRVVHLHDHENRVVIAGRRLPGARALSARLRARLAAIGSSQARKIGVRTLTRIREPRASR
jgi:hypothetical protein